MITKTEYYVTDDSRKQAEILSFMLLNAEICFGVTFRKKKKSEEQVNYI